MNRNCQLTPCRFSKEPFQGVRKGKGWDEFGSICTVDGVPYKFILLNIIDNIPLIFLINYSTRRWLCNFLRARINFLKKVVFETVQVLPDDTKRRNPLSSLSFYNFLLRRFIPDLRADSFQPAVTVHRCCFLIPIMYSREYIDTKLNGLNFNRIVPRRSSRLWRQIEISFVDKSKRWTRKWSEVSSR